MLETPGGQTVTLQDGPGQIELRDSNGNTVTLAASGGAIAPAASGAAAPQFPLTGGMQSPSVNTMYSAVVAAKARLRIAAARKPVSSCHT